MIINKARFLLFMFLFGFVSLSANAGGNLSSSAYVNITSDTSATAKTMALDEARHQIIKDTVLKYVIDKEKFKTLLDNSKSDELTDLISSANIEDEKQSSTTYSANIKMTLDKLAVKNWLNENSVDNWLDNINNQDTKSVIINLSGGLQDWIYFNNALAEKNTGLIINKISNKQAAGIIQTDYVNDLKAVIKSLDWKYQDNSGVLNIYK